MIQKQFQSLSLINSFRSVWLPIRRLFVQGIDIFWRILGCLNHCRHEVWCFNFIDRRLILNRKPAGWKLRRKSHFNSLPCLSLNGQNVKPFLFFSRRYDSFRFFLQPVIIQTTSFMQTYMGVGQVKFSHRNIRLSGTTSNEIDRLYMLQCFLKKPWMNRLFVSFQTKSYSCKILQNIDDGEICSLYTRSLKGENLCSVLLFGIKRRNKEKWRSKFLSIS